MPFRLTKARRGRHCVTCSSAARRLNALTAIAATLFWGWPEPQIEAQEKQVWKVAYRLPANEYDRMKFKDPAGAYDHVATKFSPDGEVIAAGFGNGLVRLHKAADGTLLKTLEGHQRRVSSLQFSKDGARLLSTCRYGESRLWSVPDGRLIARIHELPPGAPGNEGSEAVAYKVYFAELCSDGFRLLTMGEPDAGMLMWREDKNGRFAPSIVAEVEPGEMPDAGKWSADGTSVAVIYNSKLARYDTGRMQVTQELHPDPRSIFEVISGDYSLNRRCGDFSPDGTKFCVRTADKSGGHNGVVVVDCRDWKVVCRVGAQDRSGFATLAWSPDSKHLALVPRRQSLAPVIADANTGAVVRRLQAPPLRESEFLGIYHVDYSPDGKYVLGSRPTLYQVIFGDSRPKYDFIWDATSGDVVARLEGAPDGSKSRYSPDGKRIVNWAPQPTVWERVK